MKYYAILVVYNMDISQSVSYCFINRYRDIQLVVVDNSDQENRNRVIVSKDGNTYLSMNGNKGLSKAYNTAIDWIRNDNPEMDGYVILLDDDTYLNDTYIKEIRTINCDIAVPVVKAGDSIISPCRMKNGIASQWDGKSTLSKFSAINSGMIISLRIFTEYRYDEGLFLDYVDHKFMKDMKDKNIQIMDVELKQSFSGVETTDQKSDQSRFQLFKKDSQYFYKGNLLSYLYVVGKRKLRLTMKYRNLFFMFM